MTDSSADPTPDATLPELLLALQAIDTQADQLTHRRAHSPLRDEFTAASNRATQWERQRAAFVAAIAEFGASIDRAEAQGAELLEHRQRLDRQLKTVIAPREAEALMHEISNIEAQRDELDVVEMDALEQQAALDDQLAAHLAEEEAITGALSLADQALAVESGDIDAELERLARSREDVRSSIADSVLTTYDRKREALGVAVAPLVGRQCQGCHLELSAAEIDTVKTEAAATGVTDCPDCGRLLIV